MKIRLLGRPSAGSQSDLSRICLCALALVLAAALSAQNLNDTGVTRCFDDAGAPIACSLAPAYGDARFGRDAAATLGLLKKIGAGPAGFDFTKIANDGRELPVTAKLGNGSADWACTRDNTTGLMWEVKRDGDTDFRSRRQHYTWYNPNSAENGGNAGSREVTFYDSCNSTVSECNTLKYLEKLNGTALCGFRDWRLPTPSELRGIVNYEQGMFGEFMTDYFTTPDPQWPSPHFWTSATYAPDPADGWLVEINGEADGGGAGHHHPKNEQRLVLAVRGSPLPSGDCRAGTPRANVLPSTPTADFVDHGDGTVTHIRTRLMWKRCAEGLSGENCEIGASPQQTSAEELFWSHAVERAETSTFAGYDDWRVPNLKELYSIVEHCGHALAINQKIFPNPGFRAGPVFWVSTVDPGNPANVLLLAFEHGGAVPAARTNKLYLRLVRSGGLLSSFDAQDPKIPFKRRRAARH